LTGENQELVSRTPRRVPGASSHPGLIGAGQGRTPDKGCSRHLRASQINGCAACIDGGVKARKQAGESDERLSPSAPGARRVLLERARVALAEAMTARRSGRPVPTSLERGRSSTSTSGRFWLVLWMPHQLLNPQLTTRQRPQRGK